MWEGELFDSGDFDVPQLTEWRQIEDGADYVITRHGTQVCLCASPKPADAII